jgi:hypothetical protein
VFHFEELGLILWSIDKDLILGLASIGIKNDLQKEE